MSDEELPFTQRKFILENEGITIDHFLISDDLNDCVEALLKKEGSPP